MKPNRPQRLDTFDELMRLSVPYAPPRRRRASRCTSSPVGCGGCRSLADLQLNLLTRMDRHGVGEADAHSARAIFRIVCLP
jgi:hypothetical protein